MRFSSKPLAAVALVGLVNIALAQDIAQPAAMAADVSAPGIRTVAEMVQLSGQVVSVNMETREVLVEGPNGNQVTLTAGDEIKNLAAVTPGDIVTAEVARTITLKLLKNSDLEVGRVEAVQQGTAPITDGEGGAIVIDHMITGIADVVSVDPATMTVVLQGAELRRALKIADPEQFLLVEVGDQVEIQYLEGAALSLQKQAAE